jgi:hypothetical protein
LLLSPSPPWLSRGSYALPFSATHTRVPAFPTPSGVRHKRNRARTLRVHLYGADARCLCPAGAHNPAAHRHRVSLH